MNSLGNRTRFNQIKKEIEDDRMLFSRFNRHVFQIPVPNSFKSIGASGALILTETLMFAYLTARGVSTGDHTFKTVLVASTTIAGCLSLLIGEKIGRMVFAYQNYSRLVEEEARRRLREFDYKP